MFFVPRITLVSTVYPLRASVYPASPKTMSAWASNQVLVDEHVSYVEESLFQLSHHPTDTCFLFNIGCLFFSLSFSLFFFFFFFFFFAYYLFSLLSKVIAPASRNK
ncbi:hypothetical protein BO99DRAFT_257480 [Aspergillus violaceofuscus CBS 115571]|uniref:Uncharacterized protein n=1 Tax=Aspergillus violaceofuscus (strain CBS 115571) TaxID=1450538 RepID=A0A2V5HFV3_ASPV1|nr:hypothetical protein BO99DRAFT_257480 [Aspergillus violaceofuscus CBS 115571]